MEPEEDSENQAFKVNDRRRFAADGSPLDPAQEAAAEASRAADAVKSEATSASEPAAGLGEESAGDVSLAGLVLSIAAGAQMGLGIAPHPLTGKTEKDLKQAKQSIDLLALLLEKTKGNATREEEQLLQALLYDLRMRYVEAKGQNS